MAEAKRGEPGKPDRGGSIIEPVGRGGQETDTIPAESLLYGSHTRIFRDRFIDYGEPGDKARHQAETILHSYLEGDLKLFLAELRQSRRDPERIPDEDSPLLLDLYRSVAKEEIRRDAQRLGIEKELDAAETEELADLLFPPLHQRICELQDLVRAGGEISRNRHLGRSFLRRGELEDVAYLVEGKLSDHYCGRLAESENVMQLSAQARGWILNGQATPAAEEAFHKALRRLVITEANAPEGTRFPGDKFERSEFSVHCEGDGNVHLRGGPESALCGSQVSSRALIGSWHDVDYPGSSFSRCKGCEQAGAGSGLMREAEEERSDTSPRLQGDPALGGMAVDDFIDGIARSPEVLSVLRESVEPKAERSYEKLCKAIRGRLHGIEPLALAGA